MSDKIMERKNAKLLLFHYNWDTKKLKIKLQYSDDCNQFHNEEIEFENATFTKSGGTIDDIPENEE